MARDKKKGTKRKRRATRKRAVRGIDVFCGVGGLRRFDLSELVSQVVEAGTAEHEVAIDYNIDIPPRFCVYADPDHMLRVLENLSRNAAQALMAKGATDGRPKAIRFAAIRTDGLALVEISDTGPGFPPDQHDRIFEPFHKSTSDVGAGLGLAIAADLVTRNGGAIALAPGKAAVRSPSARRIQG